MAAIAIAHLLKNDISRKIIELETSFWCQTICFWYQGIIGTVYLLFYCQICEIFTFWFLFTVNYNFQHMGVDLVCLMQFYLLNIHVRCPNYDIHMGVELSPWSNFDKIEKSKMAAITICAFIKNDIYIKVIELENSYWCQTICFWYQGIIWNCVYGCQICEIFILYFHLQLNMCLNELY